MLILGETLFFLCLRSAVALHPCGFFFFCVLRCQFVVEAEDVFLTSLRVGCQLGSCARAKYPSFLKAKPIRIGRWIYQKPPHSSWVLPGKPGIPCNPPVLRLLLHLLPHQPDNSLWDEEPPEVGKVAENFPCNWILDDTGQKHNTWTSHF